MDTQTIEMLGTIATQFGTGAIFLYLYLSERKNHDKTRQKYNDDLRDAAGFEPHRGLKPPALSSDDTT